MWQAMCVVMLFVVCIAARRYGKCRRIKQQERRREERVCTDQERERRREAHYMRNFWSYDGAEQEEFEG